MPNRELVRLYTATTRTHKHLARAIISDKSATLKPVYSMFAAQNSDNVDKSEEKH